MKRLIVRKGKNSTMQRVPCAIIALLLINLSNSTFAQKREWRYTFTVNKVSLEAVLDSGEMSGLIGERLTITYKGKEVCRRIRASTAIPTDAPQPLDIIKEKHGKPDYVGSYDNIDGHQMAVWFGKKSDETIYLSIAREKDLALIVWEDRKFLKENLIKCKSCSDVFDIPDAEGNRILKLREVNKSKK